MEKVSGLEKKDRPSALGRRKHCGFLLYLSPVALKRYLRATPRWRNAPRQD
jgi:hypothetical protein